MLAPTGSSPSLALVAGPSGVSASLGATSSAPVPVKHRFPLHACLKQDQLRFYLLSHILSFTTWGTNAARRTSIDGASAPEPERHLFEQLQAIEAWHCPPNLSYEARSAAIDTNTADAELDLERATQV